MVWVCVAITLTPSSYADPTVLDLPTPIYLPDSPARFSRQPMPCQIFQPKMVAEITRPIMFKHRWYNIRYTHTGELHQVSSLFFKLAVHHFGYSFKKITARNVNYITEFNDLMLWNVTLNLKGQSSTP